MLPAHLKRYVVDQDYARYTPADQAVWRYIMRQLTHFLSRHAHPCYLSGLEKTGISVEQIPNIEEMSAKLEKFGWRAVPVSGFIPPAAFMEIQAHGYLPIASDLRSAEHIAYTPAPDIVHEAAGHAPILVEPEYADYLRSYAQVAQKAIVSSEDIEQYEAIRILSDLKEDADSTHDMINHATRRLNEVTRAISHVSEAALLGRMNWWTAEYGLIGAVDDPKIFGAGLLSSVGESRSCLDRRVKKIPLSIECIDYSYDITEPQPQLFVTPNFARLRTVLDELAQRMAFMQGGLKGLERARQAKTVNTVELNSGVQIAGILKEYKSINGAAAYLSMSGPSQLSLRKVELPGHGTKYHATGFGSPVGRLRDETRCLSELNDNDLLKIGIKANEAAELLFASGVVVRGKVNSVLRDPESRKVLLISFVDCRVTFGDELLFSPDWGTYDMAVGSEVVSVFGGPADRQAFGETADFAAKVIPKRALSPEVEAKNQLFGELRLLRVNLASRKVNRDQAINALKQLVAKIDAEPSDDWLVRLEAIEISHQLGVDFFEEQKDQLGRMVLRRPEVAQNVADGLRLLTE